MEAAFYHTFLPKLDVPDFIEPFDNQINSTL